MPITWNPPDLIASIILSIPGGVIAGLIVVAGEWLWRYCDARNRRRRTLREVALYFDTWESQIYELPEKSDEEDGIHPPREAFQFAIHKARIREFHISMDRWRAHLSEHQTEGVVQLVRGHEALVNIIPSGAQPDENLYRVFFKEARKISWLKF